jgi:hypothetical protein
MIRISKINNYQEINKNLLSLIEKIPINPFKTNDSISHTDWNLPPNFKREYVKYFFEIIKPYMDQLALNLNARVLKISNAWFQQYENSNHHGWHAHPGGHFTNVYFVELPSKSLGTEILNYDQLDLNEGDLLTFPAYYFHRSPVNNLGKRKTIISFNSDIDEYNG